MGAKHQKLDMELRHLVQDGVLTDNNVSITKIVQLLQKGANPHTLASNDKLSAYDIVIKNNDTGKYNFIV